MKTGFMRNCSVALFLALRVLAGAADYTLAVNCDSEMGTVAPELMGFNAIYDQEPDAQWRNGAGNLPALLAGISTKMIRFPAGTVVTFWHWTDPSVPGHRDSWDPNYNRSNDKPASATMSIDEYLAYCAARHTTPLVGINMGSGKRWNRVQDGIDEAKALVRHCMASGVEVRYYYLDNEPYQKDANYTFTAEEYADQINLYVPALKAVNPDIKIIVNLHPGANQTGYDYTRTAVQKAGANIDYVDIHMYWRHGSATFAGWTEEPHMTHQRKRPYSEQRKFYRQMFAEAGYPNVELAVLEWNIGPSGSGNPEPTEAECALMAGEEFMQFIQSGIKLATCWPLHFGGRNMHRAVVNTSRGYAPNKLYGMFAQFANAGTGMQVGNTLGGGADPDRLTHLSVISADGTTLTVYLINKNQTALSSTIDLDLTAFANFVSPSAVGFESTDNSNGPLDVHPIAVAKSGNHVTFAMAKNSFAKITVSRPDSATR